MKCSVATLAITLLFPAVAWADGPDDDGAWTDDEPTTEEAPDAPAAAPAAPQTTVIIGGQSSPSTDAAARAVAPGMVRLFIESPKRVAVYETHGRRKVGRKVCDAPCGKVVDGSAGTQFIVKGRGVGASPAFDLDGLQGDARLLVDPGSRGQKAGGIVMVVFGSLGLAAGSLVAGWGIVGDLDDDARTAAGLIGAGSILAGAGLLTGGIALIAGSGTEVEVVPQGRAPSVDPPEEWSSTRPPTREVRPVYWRGEF